MAFWGIEVEPGKSFTHGFDNTRGRLHISRATLGVGGAAERSVVQCKVGDKPPIFLCSLGHPNNESCQLDFEFEEEDGEVTFEVIGSQSVHLAGFYIRNMQVNPCPMRILANGLIIEELKMGQPNSQLATISTKVSVHYIGKIQSNGLIFEATVGTQPLIFTPGDGKAIKGLDTGINGMHIGGKRRLTIPPSMGYGSTGKISVGVPPDSWLEIEAELVNISKP